MPALWVTRRLPDVVLKATEAHFDVTVRDEITPVSRNEMREALMRYDAILPTLGDALSGDDLAGLGDIRCRMLANFGVGYNHIDITAAQALGMQVSNTPGAVTDATADIAMTLILMTARRAGEGERMVRAGRWPGWHPTQLLGMHVTGKRLGIVGMGRIGKAIAHRCHYGFGMEVAFFNRSRVSDPGMPATQVADLKELAANVDILVVALPGGAETRHMIDGSVFAAMQPQAIFVNIARGDIVDERALIVALQSGQIAGAGLDVYEFEPAVPDALTAMENVVLLPHLGTSAMEVRVDMGLMAVDNLIAFAEGRVPPNLIG